LLSAPPGVSVWFQSTRPARGATAAFWRALIHLMFQSTRPARGATRSGIQTEVA